MGNCMFARFGSEGDGVIKVISHGGIYRRHYFHEQYRKSCGDKLRVPAGLRQVDVRHGMDLELENVDLPCRLSSGTASDLLSKIGSSGESRRPSLEVLPSQQKGVWKVKLVITVEQLHEILAHQSNTEALIERMRLTASANAISSENDHQIGCFSRASTSNSSSSWKPSLHSISETFPFDIMTENMEDNFGYSENAICEQVSQH